MNLEEIIIKSRRLVDKLRRNEEAHLTKEDYFMICVSLFVAKKESVMKKNNKTSTLYFDYKEHRKEYELMDFLFDRMLMEDLSVMVDTPGLGKFDLTRTGCFDGIENLRFPFNLKIEVENFDGTLNELNEIKRIMWIYSKIRDSFAHGDKFELDIENNRIHIKNNLSHEVMGSFEFIISFPLEVLTALCGLEPKPEHNIYYGSMNAESYRRFQEITALEAEKSPSVMDELLKEISDINGRKELRIIATILSSYQKAYPKLNKARREEYLERIVEIIVTFASRSRENNEKSREMMKILSNILSTEQSNYHSVLYTHMLFVFANAKNINSDNIKTTYFEVENDPYARIIFNEIARTNKVLNNLLNVHIDPMHTRDVIIVRISKIINLIEMRNREILNSLRNGIMHTNINVTDTGIEIFDRQDNTDENSKISFKCRTTFEKMDRFLLEMESNEKQEEILNIDEFLEEIRTICGDCQTIELFALYMNSFADFIARRHTPEENLSEEDTPPKF